MRKGECEGVREGECEGMREGECEGVREGECEGVREGECEDVREGECEGVRGVGEGGRVQGCEGVRGGPTWCSRTKAPTGSLRKWTWPTMTVSDSASSGIFSISDTTLRL